VIKCVYARFCFSCNSPCPPKSVVVPSQQLLTHFSDEQLISFTILSLPFPPAACDTMNHLVTFYLHGMKFAHRCKQENKQRFFSSLQVGRTGLEWGIIRSYSPFCLTTRGLEIGIPTVSTKQWSNHCLPPGHGSIQHSYVLQESCIYLLIFAVWNTHRISLFACLSYIWPCYRLSLIMPSKLQSCWKQHPGDTGKSTICWTAAVVSCSTLDFCKEVPRVTFITNTWKKKKIGNLRAGNVSVFNHTKFPWRASVVPHGAEIGITTDFPWYWAGFFQHPNLNRYHACYKAVRKASFK